MPASSPLGSGSRLSAPLAAAIAVSRNTVALAYQALRDDGMAESRQGSGTRLMPHLITPAAAHGANGFFAGGSGEAELSGDHVPTRKLKTR
jgi:DNA-binding FadR family transcriptional regulator